jgi:DNA-binding response OmpR family regulator
MNRRACLLLVEDDPALRETLSDALDDIGYDVVVACSGVQALAELEADAAQFEEVITDINLGTGPDGWDVGRRARECVADMPVVYMSGNSDEWPSQGVANSVFIPKPFRLAQMVNAHDVALAAGGETLPETKAQTEADRLHRRDDERGVCDHLNTNQILSGCDCWAIHVLT